MKYLFIAVMFLACNKNLKIQGGDKQNIFLDHISDWAVHESGGTWRADNDYPKWIFGSDKVTKITFPDGYHTLPANDTLPGVCKHIYVSTQPAEVKIDQPVLSHLGGIGVPLPGHGFWRSRESGKKEGQEIVCVKCYHVTRQVLDYGPPQINPDSLWRLKGDGTLIFDTIFSNPTFPILSGAHIFSIDSAGVLQAKPQKKRQ